MINNVKKVRLSDVKFEETDDKMILEGYAIVFNSETLIGEETHGFIEVIDGNALADAFLKDVPMKYNHMDSFLIIARTKNKSLQLTIDNIGLKVHAELIDTGTNKDIYKMVRSGLLDKMSFAFTVKEQTWNREGEIPKRIITKIDRLYDVSVVDTPAYDVTSIHARSVEAMDLELQAMELVTKAKDIIFDETIQKTIKEFIMIVEEKNTIAKGKGETYLTGDEKKKAVVSRLFEWVSNLTGSVDNAVNFIENNQKKIESIIDDYVSFSNKMEGKASLSEAEKIIEEQLYR